ncbi:MAG: hypothetical protein EBT80_00400 [Chitinophagales bacterium]|nr:hypothetical protein [Chitinophagales bacterium]
MDLSDDVIDGVHHRLWGEARDRFGSVTAVPKDVMWGISEYVRGLHVLQVFWKEGGSGSAVSMLRSYGISEGCVEAFVRDGFLGRDRVVVEKERPSVSRKARLRAFEDWAGKHRGEQFSTDELVEVSGFSRGALLNYLKFSRLFVKVKRGVFEVVSK